VTDDQQVHQTVEHVMRGMVVTIDARAVLRDAARVLRDEDVGTLAIMNGPTLVGILSERDIVRALADDADPDEVWVGDIMSEEPRYLTPGDRALSAIDIMLTAGIRHLPVVEDTELVGIVSMRDLTRELRTSP